MDTNVEKILESSLLEENEHMLLENDLTFNMIVSMMMLKQL